MTESRIILQQRIAYPDFSLDVDLQLPARGVTVLFGTSGCGKTTLLRGVAGLEPTARGCVVVGDACWQDDAQSLFLPTYRRDLGYVFQDASLFPHLTVQRNLDFGLRRIEAAQRKVSLEQAIELLGIAHLLSRMPEKLSGGEKQRVAIARALALSPRLLLMDEPLAALDVARKQDILPYLEHLHRELEIPVLYVTHAPDEAARLADQIVVLEQGRVRAQGAFDVMFARTDLSLGQGEEAGVVLEATLAAHDTTYHLSRADFAGGGIWLRDTQQEPVGRRVRLRILARDVSLTLASQRDTSILNILPATVATITPDTHPAQALVSLHVGGSPLLARITRRSVDALQLAPGKPVWAQIKAAALLR